MVASGEIKYKLFSTKTLIGKILRYKRQVQVTSDIKVAVGIVSCANDLTFSLNFQARSGQVIQILVQGCTFKLKRLQHTFKII